MKVLVLVRWLLMGQAETMAGGTTGDWLVPAKCPAPRHRSVPLSPLTLAIVVSVQAIRRVWRDNVMITRSEPAGPNVVGCSAGLGLC